MKLLSVLQSVAIATLVAALTVAVNWHPVTAQNQPILMQVSDGASVIQSFASNECLPPNPANPPNAQYTFDWVSSVQDSRPEVLNNDNRWREFHLFRVNRPWETPNYWWETLTAVDGNGQCENLIGQPIGTSTLTFAMPTQLAGQLALERFRQLQQTAEGQDYIARLLSEPPITDDGFLLYDDIPAIAPEDAWALRELGYIIPSSFEELPAQIPYQERTNGQIFIEPIRHHAALEQAGYLEFSS